MEDEFVEIEWNSKYAINKKGVVKNLETKKNLKPVLGGRKPYLYYMVRLTHRKCKAKMISIHRLVAMHFIPNPENKPQVNHKDGNKLNNNDWNLEWCTCKENIQHAWKNGLSKSNLPFKSNENMRKPICINGVNYNSRSEAAKELKIHISNISKMAKGKINNPAYVITLI